MMEVNWLGTSVEDMCGDYGPYNFDVSTLSPSKYHAVLYDQPVDLKTPPNPHWYHQTRHWDDDHVKMPYSVNNLFPVKDENGEDVLKKRWQLIEEALLRPICTVEEFEAAITSYNTRLPRFLALQHFLNEVLGEEECEAFFETLLPGIVRLALRLPEILPGNLPLLKKEHCRSISLSQLQIASLLANGFLCTFPWRKDVSAKYPGANFVRLFAAHLRPERVQAVSEKLKCLLHYFRRVLLKAPVGVVTFQRKFLQRNQVPRWDRLENNIGNTRLHVSSTGTIEDDGHGFLQVDFANKFVGGGVLGFGCVQEEIRYVICPELIVSRLFTEELGSREALIIRGVERFSDYSGYGDTFTWDGNHQDQTPFDRYGRRRTSVVAIDASRFDRHDDQLNSSSILRELNKAYVGFHSARRQNLAPIATGNWGCGAYKGDPRLKFMVQLMACSAANRNMVYYTFGDADLRDVIYDLYSFLAANKVTVCQLWRLLCRFVAAELKLEKFFPFIQQAYFDTKHQTSIKTFFDANNGTQSPEIATTSTSSSTPQKKTETETNDVPSTSFADQSSEDSDIVESSQNEDEPVNVKYKKLKYEDFSKKHDDIMRLINIVDGKENVLKPKESSSECNSLLSYIDTLSKSKICERNKKKEESVCVEMDVEDIIEDIWTGSDVEIVEDKVPQLEACRVKRKISDYFPIVNK